MSRSLSLLTVATVDYIPQAVSTLRSARRHGNYASFHLFAVDAIADTAIALRKLLGDDAAWIRIFCPDDLGPERAQFVAAFKQYNAMELCCLAKYVGLAHVMRDPSAGEVCIFIDGDMFFVGDVQGSIGTMGESAVFVTPHLMAPATDDVEQDIMMHGWMNAGVLAFRREHPGSRTVLDWLIDRISRRGFFAPQFGLSCDQKWLSALPILFRGLTSMSTDSGLNVGYWNLTERPLTRSGGTIFAGDKPLLLFHFSGFDWAGSGRLSKHSADRVVAGSILEELCQLYQSELDGTARLRNALNGLETVPCATGSVLDRMQSASVRNGVDFIVPAPSFGLFSRLGGKMDSLLRKTVIRQGR